MTLPFTLTIAGLSTFLNNRTTFLRRRNDNPCEEDVKEIAYPQDLARYFRRFRNSHLAHRLSGSLLVLYHSKRYVGYI